MKKIIAALFMAAVLAITATGCMGASNTANDKATGDEAKSHRAEDYTNDLEGLCNYFASFGYINPQAPSTIMSMDAALIGAVEGNRYVGYKNEQSDYTYLTIELYQYDTSKENATADEIVKSVNNDGTFSILGLDPVKNVYMSNKGTFLMIYKDSKLDENKKDDEHYKLRETIVKQFKEFDTKAKAPKPKATSDSK